MDRRPPSRPQSSMNDRSYQNHRYRDEINSDHHEHMPPSKPSFQNHVNRLDERYEQTHNTRFRGTQANCSLSLRILFDCR